MASHRISGQSRNGSRVPNRPSNTDASAQLRDRLLAGIATLACSDEAALWAHRSLRDKNRLSEQDALDVEQAFEARLATLSPASEIPPSIDQADSDPVATAVTPEQPRSSNSASPGNATVATPSTRPHSSSPNRGVFVTAITSGSSHNSPA